MQTKLFISFILSKQFAIAKYQKSDHKRRPVWAKSRSAPVCTTQTRQTFHRKTPEQIPNDPLLRNSIRKTS